MYKELELEITGLFKIPNQFKKKPHIFQVSWADELVCLYCKRKRRGRIMQTLIYHSLKVKLKIMRITMIKNI